MIKFSKRSLLILSRAGSICTITAIIDWEGFEFAGLKLLKLCQLWLVHI